MKRFTIGVFLIVFALSAVAYSYQRSQQDRTLRVESIAEDVYMITGPGGNVGVLVTDDGVVIVDDKFDQDAAAIHAKVKDITDMPIKYLINTHVHGDHTGGNGYFGKITDIIGHRNIRQRMLNAGSDNTPPVITFTESMSLHIGGKDIEIYHYGPGHTDTDAIVYFKDSKTVHMGDLLFHQSHPFIDFSRGASTKNWVTILERVQELDIAHVIPGHGPSTDLSGIVAMQTYLIHLSEQVREQIRKGVQKPDIRQAIDMSAYAHFERAQMLDRVVPALYDEIAAE